MDFAPFVALAIFTLGALPTYWALERIQQRITIRRRLRTVGQLRRTR